MGMHGSNGVGCATSLTSAARLAAAATACHVPALDGCTDDARAGRAHTPPHGGADRLGSPPRPGATDCAHAPVTGGGAAAAPARPLVTADPALAALAGMLGGATPPPRGESVLQQLTTSLSNLLASVSTRLGALRPEAADPDATAPLALVAEPTVEVPRVDPSLVLRQPPPPPIGPILSLDPATGMIVDPLDGLGSGDGQGGDGGEGSLGTDDPQVGLPSSWVPVPSGVLARVRRRLGSLVDRLDALLDEVGMTRLQLLLLTLLGPAAVAFAIDVVVQLLAGR
jgi:hypothetical protein